MTITNDDTDVTTNCLFEDWDATDTNKAKFKCNVGTNPASVEIGNRTITCTIDTTKSYAPSSFSALTTEVNVTPDSCGGYLSSGTCEADSACDWCEECNANNWYSGGGDRCVAAGSCSYSLTADECTAQCDQSTGCPTYDCTDDYDNDCYDASSPGFTGDQEYRTYNTVSRTCSNTGQCSTPSCTYSVAEPNTDTDLYDNLCDNDCGPLTSSINPGIDESLDAYRCNGLDDNCDGVTDGPSDGADFDWCGSCTDGESITIGTTDVGECEYGELYCNDGTWVEDPAVGPSLEVCDGLDNDCDGQTDEDNVCAADYHQITITGDVRNTNNDRAAGILVKGTATDGTTEEKFTTATDQNGIYALEFNDFEETVDFDDIILSINLTDFDAVFEQNATVSISAESNTNEDLTLQSYCGDHYCDDGEDQYCADDCTLSCIACDKEPGTQEFFNDPTCTSSISTI